jgi:PKD domain-containing protein/IPT/TIG domain-containing protein
VRDRHGRRRAAHRPRAAPRLSAARASLALALALALAAGLLALGPGGASALVVHLPDGRAVSYLPLRHARPARPFDAFFKNLDYNGGPVMASNANYPFYWAPSGSPAYPTDYRPGINRYLEDLAHDSAGAQNVDSVSAQYNDASGQFAAYKSKFGGALIDTDPYPANGCARAAICLTDAQIQAELRSFVSAHGLPADLGHVYFVLTPPGVESCFEARGRTCSAGSSRPAYCAYHGNFAVGGGQLIYADDPYVTANESCDDGNHPNNATSDGALEGGLSHEHNEAITDPLPNSAWADFAEGGSEVGDKCGSENGAALGTAADGATYNQIINGHFYWYQEEWSNQAHRCLQRLTLSGEEPTATFTVKQGAADEASFDATGSTAPGGVARYSWQFNDGPGESAPVETTSPVVSHTVAVGGFYLVALTVFASDGTSIGTAKTVLIGTPPAPAVKKVSPKRGPVSGGSAVVISGSSFTGATAVHFGAQSAASFVVNSGGEITAISPAEKRGSVDVTATTPWGTSAPTKRDRFKFR